MAEVSIGQGSERDPHPAIGGGAAASAGCGYGMRIIHAAAIIGIVLFDKPFLAGAEG
jgi:hypothetical protein